MPEKEKFVSLFEYLGLKDPDQPEKPMEAGPNLATTDPRTFALEILSSYQYRESILRRILVDDLPPAVETLLLHYAFGKPTERVEVKDVTPIESLTSEQLEDKALQLAQMARRMREQMRSHGDADPSDTADTQTTSGTKTSGITTSTTIQ